MKLFGNSMKDIPLTFVLIGNPERGVGGQKWVKTKTPTNLPYLVFDVTRKGDNWSDCKSSNRFTTMFGPIHLNYFKVDLEPLFAPHTSFNNSSLILQKQVNRTNYIMVP
jgi:hypothetical protein